MTYIQKEENIIRRLQETNYSIFDGNKDEALDFVGEQLESFPKYANTVIRQQTMMPIWKAKYDGDEWRQVYEDSERKRRSSHDNAIVSVNILNRLCKDLQLEPFMYIDTEDRQAVAESINEYITDVYGQGINTNRNVDQYYDDKRTHQRLTELEQKFDHIEPSDTNENKGFEI